ncbi:MAG: hypothetical protein HQM10_08685 [Candidatus Riflebacteria bacterium]|nr:hypothetical protein [Candidatus Riflebacteria bacterium]
MINRHFKGYTVMEILIAASLLAMIITSLIGIFRSSSDTFNAGNWRLSTQKNAQSFLRILRENIEKANYAMSVYPGAVISSHPTPIFVNEKWYNTSAPCSVNKTALFASISTTYRAPNTALGISEESGRWSAVVLSCNDDSLELRRTGDRSSIIMPTEFIFPAGKFVEAGKEVNFFARLQDVDTFSITENQSNDEKTLIFDIKLVRRVGGKKTNTVLTEKMQAKLLSREISIKKMTN